MRRLRMAVLRAVLSNMAMVLAKTDLDIAGAMRLVPDAGSARRLLAPRRRARADGLGAGGDRPSLLDGDDALARTIRHRFPYLDPLNALQVELLRRWRAGDHGPAVQRGIHLTINGLATGLRNSG
jgi:phosphoenolpyruvate carboxylase